MPDVQEDLNEGLKISEDGTGILHLTRTFFCTDLEGDNPSDQLASALFLTVTGTSHTGASIPERGELITVQERDLWCKTRSVEPWPPSDAVVQVEYDSIQPPNDFGLGPVTIEVGTSLEQDTTVFDAVNRALPWNSRAIISVPPPAAYADQPTQYPSVPVFLPKATIVLTRNQSVNPESMADTYVGKKNAATWRGYAAGTVMCVDIKGRNGGDGVWGSTFSFARDPTGKFYQVARWTLPDGTFPALSGADVTSRLGIKDVDVQDTISFSGLSLD